jgi:hypothetical protein
MKVYVGSEMARNAKWLLAAILKKNIKVEFLSEMARNAIMSTCVEHAPLGGCLGATRYQGAIEWGGKSSS